MQSSKPTCSSSSFQQRDPENCVDESATSITFKFDQSLRIDDEDEEEFLDCESGEDDTEFTFITLLLEDRPSKNNPVFPLFDQNLLSDKPHVEKVFVEMPQQASSTSMSEYDEIENIAVGPYCTWSKRNVTKNRELKKKSNSTGFSKLWRLRGKVKRSNSDGRDAFVFLQGSDRKKTSLKSVVKRAVVGEKPKVVKKGTKGQINANVSAHEVYLKKREQTEEERRRSYLPYRPEIMGFFTNVNGGLTRNVHPY